LRAVDDHAFQDLPLQHLRRRRLDLLTLQLHQRQLRPCTQFVGGDDLVVDDGDDAVYRNEISLRGRRPVGGRGGRGGGFERLQVRRQLLHGAGRSRLLRVHRGDAHQEQGKQRAVPRAQIRTHWIYS